LALDLANENIVLNELNHGKISFVKGDATTFMKGAISENELWDLVILDPPKLAPRKKVYIIASSGAGGFTC
jgi:23S rRNA G2069 N7-methylase RlmK/C1962 C5-methylase RlmI